MFWIVHGFYVSHLSQNIWFLLTCFTRVYKVSQVHIIHFKKHFVRDKLQFFPWKIWIKLWAHLNSFCCFFAGLTVSMHFLGIGQIVGTRYLLGELSWKFLIIFNLNKSDFFFAMLFGDEAPLKFWHNRTIAWRHLSMNQ